MIKNCLTAPNGIAPCERRPSTRALLWSIPGKVSCFGCSDIRFRFMNTQHPEIIFLSNSVNDRSSMETNLIFVYILGRTYCVTEYLFVCGISITSGQLINELFPDCTRSCFSQVVLCHRGGDCIYEMRCLFVAVGLNACFIVLPHWDNMS